MSFGTSVFHEFFGYRNVTLGLVCVEVCIAAIAVGSYTHCIYLYCRNALHRLTSLNYHTCSSTTYYLLTHPFIPFCTSARARARARTHIQSHTHIFLNMWK